MIGEIETNISIIMPLYNVEKYIEKCLASIKDQTFKSYELIIIDDCSTDNSLVLVMKFIKDNPEIKCIIIQNDQNRGASYSRNIGMQKAIGEYICFMDSDDSWHPLFLESLYYEIKSKAVDLVFCGYDRCYESKVVPYTQTWKYPCNNKIFDLKFRFFISKTHICHCTILYRRAFLLQTGIYYTEGCKNAGDTEFLIKILFCNPYFSYIPQSLYYYNIHPNSLSTKYPSSDKFDGYFAYERAKKYIRNPFWKMMFLLTKESKKVTHIIQEFFEHDIELPYLFCSKQKILALLFINMIRMRTSQSNNIFSYFYHTYFKKE